VLAVESVSKRFGDVTALDDVSFSIERGQVFGLIGPNGAGKSTTMLVVCGLLASDSGQVRVGGIDPRQDPWRARELLGYAPQETATYPTLTVIQNLRFFAAMAGAARADVRKRVDAVVGLLELGPILNRPTRFLSGGERRKVHVAGAMMCRPPLLLLDEPTVGMDVMTRARLGEAVQALADEGTAVCFSSHYLNEVEERCDTACIIDHGRVLAMGKVANLVAQHGEPRVELAFADGTRRSEPCEGTDVRGVLERLGDLGSGVTSVHLLQPSLEAVFTSLTGTRFEEGGKG
jgi:ABC-2 type transport system ATP-binding protein